MKKIDNLIVFRMRKLLLSMKDHWYLLFKSASHNHLRIQEIRRGENGGIFCTFSFYSYTALKRYQKKVRVVSFGLTSGLAIFLVALVLVPAFFNPSGSKAAGEIPTVSSVAPNMGPTVGGTNVTITGSNFDGVSDAETKLLIHGDGLGNSIVDHSLTSKTVTVAGNATQSATLSKFGGKSIYFDGSGDYLQLADSDDFDFGAGDYAIDFWAKTSTFDYNYLFSRASGGYPDFSLQTYPGGELRLMIENGSDSSYAVLAVTTGAGLNDGNFHHIALVRNSGNTKIYIDGVSKLSIATAYNVSFDTAFRIGAEPLFPPHLTGYIDEFRITKGISRWTDNFTPSTGAYFQPSVTFGGTLATNISLTSSTILLATTPSHVVGEVDVVVTNYDGGIGTLTNGFTYNAPLMVTSILPNNASKNGGDSVTITGNGFYGNPNVKIGGTDAININVVNATTITATTPAHVAGIFDVVVTSEDEQSGTLPSGFTFNELAPIVSSINPNSGPVAGGTDVTISGSNFLGGADENTELLLHGDGDGATFVDAAISPKTITANGDAIQSITTSKFGKSSMYFDGNGDYLTIPSSSDFDLGTSDYTVDFWVKVPTLQDAFVPFVMFGKSWAGDNQSQWIVGVSSANKIEATHTNSSGTASYVLDSTSISANTWYHIALVRSGGLITLYKNGSSIGTMNVPTSYAPQAGWYLSVGGESELHYTRLNGYIDEIRISKGVAYWTNNFTVATSQYFLEPSVTMGGLGATGVLVTSPSTIIATTPAHVSGMIDVMVANSDGQNDTLENGFAYIGPPTISSINPITTTNNQSVSGIEISGEGFQDGATVKFKKTGETDITCSNVIFDSATLLTCDGDFHGAMAGDWDVEVTNVDGQIGTASNALNITGEVTQINFTTPNYTIKPNVASQAIRIQLRDSAGRETLPAADTLVDLFKNSATGEFSLSRTSWSPIASVSFTTLETTKNIYYKDSTSGSHTIGASENPSNNWTDASQSITVNNVAPYVWPFDAAGDYTYDGAKISIANSDANLLDLAAVNPEIKNAVSASLTYSSLTSFSEVLDFDNQGSVKYQLSNDDGATWHWWNGSTWAVTTQGVTQSNDAATINTQISRYNSDIGQIGNAKLSFKAFLIGDGAQKVSLDSIFVGYGLFPYKYALIENPTSLNEAEVGTFTVQAQDQNGNVIAVDHDTVVSLGTSAPSTGFFATDLNEDISTRWDKQLVTIPEGQNSATFYYKDSQKGTPTLSITPPIGEETLPINYPLTVISKYRFLVTGVSDPIQAGVPSSVTIQAADYLGNPVTSYTGNVHFTSSDAASSLPADNVLTAPMLGGKTYVNGVTMMTQAEQCVTVTDESDSIITGSQCAITVTAPPAGVASKLKIISNQQFVPVGEVSSSITVQLQDINNSPAVKSIPTTVYVYRTTASGQFSEDGFSSWTSAAFTVIIPAGATSANFFYMDSAIGNYVMTVSDDNVEGQDIGLTNDSQQLSAVAGSPASLSFNSSPAIIAGVATGALNFSLHDSLGNQVTTQSNQAAIITSSNGGEFSLDGSSNWTNKLFTGISTGDYENDFYYRNNLQDSRLLLAQKSLLHL